MQLFCSPSWCGWKTWRPNNSPNRTNAKEYVSQDGVKILRRLCTQGRHTQVHRQKLRQTCHLSGLLEQTNPHRQTLPRQWFGPRKAFNDFIHISMEDSALVNESQRAGGSRGHAMQTRCCQGNGSESTRLRRSVVSRSPPSSLKTSAALPEPPSVTPKMFTMFGCLQHRRCCISLRHWLPFATLIPTRAKPVWPRLPS